MELDANGQPITQAPPTGTPPATTPPVTPPAGDAGKKETSKEKENFDNDDWMSSLTESQQSYIKRLRSENGNKKEKIADLSNKLTAKEKAEIEAQQKRDEEAGDFKNMAERERKLREETEKKIQAKNDRILKAELRNQAIKEGIIDPTDVDLFGLDGLSLDDNDEPVGVEKRVKELKKTKPHLFKIAAGSEEPPRPQGTTNGDRQPPAPQTTAKTKNAMDMSAEEFRAAEAKLISESKSRMW